MSASKTLKARLQGVELAGTKVRVVLAPDEIQTYSFDRSAGSGDKGVTWKVTDRFGWPFALKFVPKAEYYAHSVDAELYKVRKLGTRFAQICVYGEPQFEKSGLETVTKEAYAVVVEWVDGQTFAEFCAQEG